MSILVAKKYVKALIKDCEISNVTQINEQIKLIASAYSDKKFNEIISSIDVSSDKKVSLINSFIEDANSSVVNLIKLLASNKRLNIVPNISSELNKEVSILNNSFEGFVYSSEKLSSEYMSNIQENFAKKFNCTLNLENIVNDYDGIKVDIEGLGIEISFAKNQFKSQMIEHILKAV
jgi:F-type H+-transporting ATPase subunit delta